MDIRQGAGHGFFSGQATWTSRPGLRNPTFPDGTVFFNCCVVEAPFGLVNPSSHPTSAPFPCWFCPWHAQGLEIPCEAMLALHFTPCLVGERVVVLLWWCKAKADVDASHLPPWGCQAWRGVWSWSNDWSRWVNTVVHQETVRIVQAENQVLICKEVTKTNKKLLKIKITEGWSKTLTIPIVGGRRP